MDNFRIIGEQLLGDLNLLENAEKREYILEIANKLPDTFGISIAFSGPVRERDGRRFASCNELYSADLVQTPAANPTGLFSFEAKGVDNNFNQMEDATIEIEPKEKEDEISIADIVSRLTALETAFGDYKKKMEEMPAAEPEKKEEMSEDSALSKLEAKLDTIISNFGAAPLKASVVAEEKAQESFDLKAVVESKTKELGSRIAAIKFAMVNHPNEYIALRDANQLNF